MNKQPFHWNKYNKVLRYIMLAVSLVYFCGSFALDYYKGSSLIMLYDISLLAYLILSPGFRKKLIQGFRTTKIDWTTLGVLLITLITCLSIFWSPLKVETWEAIHIFLALTGFYLLLSFEFNDEETRRILLYAFVGIVLFTMGILVYQHINALLRHLPMRRGLYISTIENANNLGVLCVMFTLTCGAMLKKKRPPVETFFLGLATVLAFFGILVSQSRSIFLVTAFIITFIVWRYNVKYILVFLIFGIIILITPQLQQRFFEIFSYENNVQRVKVWRVAIQMITEHPLLGVGANAFRHGYQVIFNAHPEIFNNFDIPVIWHAHNMFLRFFSELGLGGILSLFLLLSGNVIHMKSLTENLQTKTYQGRLMDGISLALMAFYAANILDSFWISAKPLLCFYFLLGISTGLLRQHKLLS